ncbi:MAG TPA: gephyrin-like molybdotransferase Glp [Candidatus Binatia bacterium]|nr:gephyrin-like molybdotransferase Glp [Candidatus Binatia bacterium]
MTELFTVVPPSEAFRILRERVNAGSLTETIQMRFAYGRVAAREVRAPEPLPAFTRATMDGYAVRSADTAGASESAPAYLRLLGDVPMGALAEEPVGAGEAWRIQTGAMLPPGADGVVMVEETTLSGVDIEVLASIAPGENVFAAGEDAARGETIIPAGKRLRAADLGALCALGVLEIAAIRKPRIGVLSTGDEVVEPQMVPGPGQVRDVNAQTVTSLVAEAGGVPIPCGIVADDERALEAGMRAALADADALVLSAGSSVSSRDLTARVVERLGRPGILIHGVALWPGKPTVLAVCDGKPVIGLPGNPMSALIVAWRFVRPLVRFLGGERVADDGFDDVAAEAILTQNLSSRTGREDYVPARLVRGDDGALRATPIYTKSSGIVSLSRADGLIIVPLDHGGLSAGSRVRVVPL